MAKIFIFVSSIVVYHSPVLIPYDLLASESGVVIQCCIRRARVKVCDLSLDI